MQKLNSLFVATVLPFQGSNEDPAISDKNGNMPFILNVVAGTAPSKRVISGTVASRAGIIGDLPTGNIPKEVGAHAEAGKTFLFNCAEGNPDDEGRRQFTFTPVKELAFDEIMASYDKLGTAKVIDVHSEEAVDSNAPVV